MSMNYGLTPEEMLRKKKRNKTLLYVTIVLGTIVVSASLTILVNRL